MDNEIGSTIPDAANIVAYNGEDGISIIDDGALRNSIRRNAIYRNGELGIDLGDDGATANDGGDVDLGPNGLQNFPLLRSVVSGGGNTTILGAFRGAPNTTFVLEFFSNPCNFRPRDFLEGETFLGESVVNTDGNGFAPINVVLPVTVEAGAPVSATATNPVGNTSEFAQQIVFSIFPASGPAAGGAPVTISGTNFDPGVAVTIGGAAPASLVRVNDQQLTAEAPSLPPGSLNDVVVTNPDTTAGTLLKGWVADFLDVPAAHIFHENVTRLVSNGVTVGCGGGLYCVGNPTTRQQMAVFLIRARLGFCFSPRPPPAPSSATSPPPISTPHGSRSSSVRASPPAAAAATIARTTPSRGRRWRFSSSIRPSVRATLPLQRQGPSSTMSPWGSSLTNGSRTSSVGASPPAAARSRPCTARSMRSPADRWRRSSRRRSDSSEHRGPLPPRPTAGGMRYRWLRQRSLLQGACLRWTGRWSARAAVIARPPLALASCRSGRALGRSGAFCRPRRPDGVFPPVA